MICRSFGRLGLNVLLPKDLRQDYRSRAVDRRPSSDAQNGKRLERGISLAGVANIPLFIGDLDCQVLVTGKLGYNFFDGSIDLELPVAIQDAPPSVPLRHRKGGQGDVLKVA